MHAAAEAIAAIVDYPDLGAFANDELRQISVIHDFMVLGEAASRIATEIRGLSPEFTKRDMIAMRNKLIHACLGVEPGVVFRLASVALR